MRASYTAPFVDRLLADKVQVGWVGGISAGASHTVDYLSGNRARTRESFVEFPAMKEAGGLQSLARGRGYFDAEFIYNIAGLPGGVFPFDYESFATHPAQFHVETVDATTGETVLIDRSNYGGNLLGLMDWVRASSTMPGLMVMPTIGGVNYVDGALGDSGGIPIAAAEAAGFTRFAVVLTRERDFFREPIPTAEQRLLQRMFKDYPLLPELIITRWERYNAAKRRVQELEEQGKAQVFYPDTMPVTNREREFEKLAVSYRLGETQVEIEWPEWLKFFTRT